MSIEQLRSAMAVQIKKMEPLGLLTVQVDKDTLWDLYQDSFAAGDNEIYRERRVHDCNSCKQFIRNMGAVVAVFENKLISVWDVDVEGSEYAPVVKALAAYVKSKAIQDPYFTESKQVGMQSNKALEEDGSITTWQHLAYTFADKTYVRRPDQIPSSKAKVRDSAHVLQRSLDEITSDAINTTLDLIAQDSLYRGEEHKATLQWLSKLKAAYGLLNSAQERNCYAWAIARQEGERVRVRNSAIGTLLVDISEGMLLEKAVHSFEAKVAPTNYKRSKSLVTPGMIKKAQKKVEELGIEDSLYRRHAVLSDITINNVLWANRDTKKAMNVFEELSEEVAKKPKNLDKVEEVDVKRFIADILPTASSIELLVENTHQNNFVSLISPTYPESKNILKWDNNFTWSYNGEVTDSIKERVETAGGNVTGDLRASLAWFNKDDLDIHCIEPNRSEIFFSNKQSRISGGTLDVDMNAGGINNSVNPVENIIWPSKQRMPEGEYHINIHQYTQRTTENPGFGVEIEMGGKTHTFAYDKIVKGTVKVATVHLQDDVFTLTPHLPTATASKEVWGIHTNNFVKVDSVMYSPNHWDTNQTGNQHVFFMLDGCQADSARGFYNEFLSGELHEDRKVFEVLGGKMKVEPTTDQISGLGFSLTQRASTYFRIGGTFNRTIKVNF